MESESAAAPDFKQPQYLHQENEIWSPLVDYDGAFVDISSVAGNALPLLRTNHPYTEDRRHVSMSKAQPDAHTPQTPASERAQNLGLPLDYIQRILHLSDEPLDQDDFVDRSDVDPPNPNTMPDNLTPRPLFDTRRPLLTRAPPLTQYNRRPSMAARASPQTPVRNTNQALSDKLSLYYHLAWPTLNLDCDTNSPTQHTGRQAPAHTQQWSSNLSPRPAVTSSLAQTNNLTSESSETLRQCRTSFTMTTPIAHPTEDWKQSPTSIYSPVPGSSRRPGFSDPFARSTRTLTASSGMVTSPTGRTSESESPFGTHTFQWTSSETSGTEYRDGYALQSTDRVSSFYHKDTVTPRPSWTGDARDRSGYNVASIPTQQQAPDASVDSFLLPITPPQSDYRRRLSSDVSIYHNRPVTRGSTYDDMSAFANVSDRTSGNFKALSDSFQNSSIRVPKLSSLRSTPKLRSTSTLNVTTQGLDQRYFTSEISLASTRQQPYPQTPIEYETPRQRANTVLGRAISKLEGDVVLLGGYRGSSLRSAKAPYKQVWVPLNAALNMGKVDLEVGLDPEDEERMEENIVPNGILSHIGPIDVCRRLMKRMRKSPNGRNGKLRVHDWGYDWRLSPYLLSAKLIKFLETLECNHPLTPPEKRGAYVIAHSFGGLVTRHAVNQRPELFSGVCFAGVPQHCAAILGPLRMGDDVLFNSKILTPQVNFSIRTSFALLPDDGQFFIQRKTNRKYNLDFFDPKVWDEFRLSPVLAQPLSSAARLEEERKRALIMEERRRTAFIEERRKTLMSAQSDQVTSVSTQRSTWFSGSSTQVFESPAETEVTSQYSTDPIWEEGDPLESTADHVLEPMIKKSKDTKRGPPATITIPKEKAMAYLDRVLAETQIFRQGLKHNPEHQRRDRYPPFAIIFAKNMPTVLGARVDNLEGIRYDDVFDDLVFAAGDGVVLASAAQLPEGYRYVKGGKVETDRGHVGLMGDLEGMGKCLEALVDGRRRGVGLGKRPELGTQLETPAATPPLEQPGDFWRFDKDFE